MATQHEIKVYDLSDNVLDIWRELHRDSDQDLGSPDKEELEEIRAIIKLHYRVTGRALGTHYRAQFDDCGTYSLEFRKAKKGRNFATGQAVNIPEYFDVEFNAHPEIETIIEEAIVPPKLEVR